TCKIGGNYRHLVRIVPEPTASLAALRNPVKYRWLSLALGTLKGTSMKRFTALKFAAIAATGALALTACGSNDSGSNDAAKTDEPVKIGIAQYVSHPSLDAVAAGFKKGMESAGYTGDK